MIVRGDKVKFKPAIKLVAGLFKGIKDIKNQEFEVISINGDLCTLDVAGTKQEFHKSMLVKKGNSPSIKRSSIF